MSCSCPDTSYGGVTDDNSKFELGPAYADVWFDEYRFVDPFFLTLAAWSEKYKAGGSGVKLEWKQQKSLLPDFLSPCCTQLE